MIPDIFRVRMLIEDIRLRLTTGAVNFTSRKDRSSERYRRAAKTFGANLFARGVSALTAIVSVPLTVTYLGAERYGMWMTIASLYVLMSFADFGIGAGLLNSISEAYGKDDQEATRSYVATGFWILAATGTLLLAAIGLSLPYIPWYRLFNVTSPQAIAEASPSCAIFLACAAVSLPFAVAERVQMGFQEGYFAALWQAAGSLAGLTGVLTVIHHRLGLPWLVLAMSGGPVLSIILCFLHQFTFVRPELAPRWSAVSRAAARKVSRTGFVILGPQIGATVLSAAPFLLLARLCGPVTVAGFGILQRVFGTLVSLGQYAVAPLWPAYGEAYARGEVRWIASTFKRSNWLVLVAVVLPIVCSLPLMSVVVRILSRGHVTVPFSLTLSAGLLAAATMFRANLSMVAGGCTHLRKTVLALPLAAVLPFAAAALPIRNWPPATVPLLIVCSEIIITFCLYLDISPVLHVAQQDKLLTPRVPEVENA